MTVLFSAREIAEAAVEKERRRREFYAGVAEMSTDGEMKKLFHFLAEEEGKHVATFTLLRDSLPQGTQSEQYDEDMRVYLDSITDDRLYSGFDSEGLARKAVTGKDAIGLAIGFEKDAILYFMEFLPYLSAEDRKIVSHLIDEEKGHIRMLAGLRGQMGE